jgi:hypothetical protein
MLVVFHPTKMSIKMSVIFHKSCGRSSPSDISSPFTYQQHCFPRSVVLEEHQENLEISPVLRRQAVPVNVSIQSVSIVPRRTNIRSLLQLESSNTRMITE